MKVKTVSYRAPGAARDFAQSLRETGFAVLTDHPIPAELIDGTYREWLEFFGNDAKRDFTFDPKVQAGYFPFRSENAKDSPVKDLKEFYHYYPQRVELPAATRRLTPELYRSLSQLGGELLRWIEAETPSLVRQRIPTALSSMIDESEETLLRILHYPPLQGEHYPSQRADEAGAVRAAAHEDINLITLLPAATAPGLEVKDVNGDWHSVACDPGMIVVNAGDMLSEATGGYYPSTTHRVINPTGPAAGESRYSMPLFLHPRRNARLSEKFTAGEYLSQRLREIGLIGKS